MTSLRDRFDEHPTLITALVMLILGMTTAILGFEVLPALFFAVGLPFVVPLVYLLYDPDDEEPDQEVGRSARADPVTVDDPIEELRERYARGQLTDEEFERRLERLLETEDLEVDRTGRSGSAFGRSERRDAAFERK